MHDILKNIDGTPGPYREITSGEHASWLIPLLISITFLLLLILIGLFLRRKLLKVKFEDKEEEDEKDFSKSNAVTIHSEGSEQKFNVSNETKMTINPIFEDRESKENLYSLPTVFEKNNSHILSIQRSPMERLTWHGGEDVQDEMIFQMNLDESLPSTNTGKDRSSMMLAYANESFQLPDENETIHESVPSVNGSNSLSAPTESAFERQSNAQVSDQFEREGEEEKEKQGDDITQFADQYVDDLFDFNP